MWKSSSYIGHSIPFSEISPQDDYLHGVGPTADFTTIETYLHGFNIPEHDINCNIYFLWHPVLGTMNAHIFVHRGARILEHQLCADYYNDLQHLPAATDKGGVLEFQMGSCSVRHQVVEPLKEIRMIFDDPAKQFSLDLTLTAALPPVGRPGGHHFTQLMKTSGRLVLDGDELAIEGHYMRDRSWGYSRPEEPEQMPPYRWMTGWLGQNTGFVIAWIDTGMLAGEAFGPNWNKAGGQQADGANKWESGGPTPSMNLRSGWIAVDGDIRQVVRMDVRSLFGSKPNFLVRGIELELEDASGDVHLIEGQTLSMMPKMYWQNIVTYMHLMKLRYGNRTGHGDLMDSYTACHIKRFGL
jgi:hypothetical protein